MNPRTQPNPSEGEAISLFAHARATEPARNHSLAEVAQMIGDPGPGVRATLSRLEPLRRAGKRDDDEYKRIKAQLPAVTFAGRFPYRKADRLERHSGYVVVDVDHIDDPAALRDLAFTDPAVALSFVSPSQDGCKIVIAVEPAPADAAEHAKAFPLVAQHVRQSFDVQIDMSGRDVSRLCFLSSDPALGYRPDPRPLRWQELTAEQPAPAPAPPQPAGRDDGRARAIDRALSLIPADDYEEWLQIGQALHAGGHPLALWESWSATSDKYREGECGRKWAGFDSERGLTMGTFWEIAKRHGYEPRSAVYDATRAWSQAQRITPERDEAESYARRWNNDQGGLIKGKEAQQVGREAQMDERDRREREQDGEFRPPETSELDVLIDQVFTRPERLTLERAELQDNSPAPPSYHFQTNYGSIELTSLHRYPTAHAQFSAIGLDIRPEYQKQRAWQVAASWLRDGITFIDNREHEQEEIPNLIVEIIESANYWANPTIETNFETGEVALAIHELYTFADRHRRGYQWRQSQIRRKLRDAGFRHAAGYRIRNTTGAWLAYDDELCERVSNALVELENRRLERTGDPDRRGNQPPS